MAYATLESLIEDMKNSGVLQSPALEEAFRFVNRAKFIPANMRALAYEDQAVPIGEGQTISQPTTVAFMLEQLCVRPGNTVFDVGAGSGWQSVLLAQLVGPEGKVLAIERIPELCEEGKRNIMQYPMLAKRIDMRCGNAAEGAAEILSRYESVDRIIVAAEIFSEVPPFWLEQLSINGIIIYPHKGSLIKMTRTQSGFTTEEFPGFAFVPFIPTT